MRPKLPATVATAGHRLECDANMSFAIGLAGLNPQATKPKVVSGGIANWPFARFFCQFHQANSLGGLFYFADFSQGLRADLIG